MQKEGTWKRLEDCEPSPGGLTTKRYPPAPVAPRRIFLEVGSVSTLHYRMSRSQGLFPARPLHLLSFPPRLSRYVRRSSPTQPCVATPFTSNILRCCVWRDRMAVGNSRVIFEPETSLSVQIYMSCGRAIVGSRFGSPSPITLALSLTRSSGTPKTTPNDPYNTIWERTLP